MANIFAITTAAEDIKADAAGKASAIFTITNNSSKPVRGIARARALENTRQEWLDIDGETERDFSAHGTQQFTVTFSKPAAAAAGGSPGEPAEKFPFRLDIASATNPDEEFAEGPSVRVEVAATSAPAKKGFPWWLILVIAGGAILVGGVILFLVMQRSCNNTPRLSGTWKMKDAPTSDFDFIGILKIQQFEDGRLQALVWKRNDLDTGAPLMTPDGRIIDGVGVLEGRLERENTRVELKCKLGDTGRLLVDITIQLPPPESRVFRASQILDKE